MDENEITRRQFLKYMTLGTLGLAGSSIISACSRQSNLATTPFSQKHDVAVPLSPSPTVSQPPVNSTTVAGAADLAVARKGEPEQLVRRAIEALGGMGRFIHSGNDVIIKPNICMGNYTYERAVTTNPWVVGTLVKMCIESGAKRVRVMDFPASGTPASAYAKSGIQEQVELAGGEMESMSAHKYVKTEIPQGVDITAWDIYEDILKADVVINVPIAKDHQLARLTLGMKNLMGIVYNRSFIHFNLGQRIADLTSRIRPALTVVDAIRILTANGPSGGSMDDVKQIDTIVASPDIVAADSYAATLFGLKPDDLAYVNAGAAMGLGSKDLKSLKIEEFTVAA